MAPQRYHREVSALIYVHYYGWFSDKEESPTEGAKDSFAFSL